MFESLAVILCELLHIITPTTKQADTSHAPTKEEKKMEKNEVLHL